MQLKIDYVLWFSVFCRIWRKQGALRFQDKPAYFITAYAHWKHYWNRIDSCWSKLVYWYFLIHYKQLTWYSQFCLQFLRIYSPFLAIFNSHLVILAKFLVTNHIKTLWVIPFLFAFSMETLQIFLEIIRIIAINGLVHVGKRWRAKTRFTDALRAKTISITGLLVCSFSYFCTPSVYFSFILYSNLYLFFPSLYSDFKPFLKFRSTL